MIAQIPLEFNIFSLAISVASAVIAATGSLGFWINSQFKDSRRQMYTQLKEVYDKIDRFQTSFENKLDYHEQHDDKRFADLTDDIWAVRVRNAARDGVDLGRQRLKKISPEENGNGN